MRLSRLWPAALLLLPAFALVPLFWMNATLPAAAQRTVKAPEFDALQYTFLSQIGHRDDFRQRLAKLYEEWRGEIREDVHGIYEVIRRLERVVKGEEH